MPAALSARRLMLCEYTEKDSECKDVLMNVVLRECMMAGHCIQPGIQVSALHDLVMHVARMWQDMFCGK